MKFESERVLNEARARRVCEFCLRPLRHRGEAAHLLARQRSNAGRLDIEENVACLGGPWDCGCHGRHHSGQISQVELADCIGERVGLSAEQVLEVTRRLRWAGEREWPR